MFFYGLIGLAILGCILQAFFIVVEHKEKYVPAVILKGLASVVFCIIGFIGYYLLSASTLNLVESQKNPALVYKMAELVFEGLLLGALGDILLNLRFVFQKAGQKIFLAGIASFLAGHIVYLVSLILISSGNAWIYALCIGIILAAILLTIIFKSFELKIAFKIFGVLYIGAVCLMTTFAIANTISLRFTANSLIYALGAICFLVSDVVLIFNTFGKTTKFSLRITNLTLYYIGQLLIAGSLFFVR